MRFTIVLPADEGARFLAAIETAQLAPDGVPAETHGVERQRKTRADGLMIVTESFLAEGPKTRRGGAPHEVQLHVTQEELANKTDGAFIANAGGTGVSAETARRLSCDAAVVEVIEDEHGRTLDIGRRTRSVPTSIRRALELRDQHQCSFPGCTNTRFLDAHHERHWIDGGKTCLDNLRLLCRRHHTFVHEHGYRIERDVAGRPLFMPPQGAPLPRAWIPPDCPSDAIQLLAQEQAEQGLAIDELCLLPPHWDGESVDYEWVVDSLCRDTFYKRPRDPVPEETLAADAEARAWLEQLAGVASSP